MCGFMTWKTTNRNMNLFTIRLRLTIVVTINEMPKLTDQKKLCSKSSTPRDTDQLQWIHQPYNAGQLKRGSTDHDQQWVTYSLAITLLWFHQRTMCWWEDIFTMGERTRVSADTLVKMAEDSFIASVNYRQFYRHGAFIGDPYFLRLLPLVWETLKRSSKSW